jgi:predicted ATP-dependent endonuclease of OLD family
MKLELRSVRIKNYRPIDDIKLNFFDAAGKTLPVCVIGGVNGSGKTTILDAITVLASTLEPEEKASSKHALFSNLNPYLQTDWRLDENEFSLFKGNPPNDAQLLPARDGQKTHIAGTFNRFETVRTSPVVENLPQQIKLQSADEDFFSSIKPTSTAHIPSIIYLPHNRSLEPVTGQEIRKEEDRYRFVYRFQTVKQFSGSLNSYLRWLADAHPERGSQMLRFLNNLNFDGKTFWIDHNSSDVKVRTLPRKNAPAQEHGLHELSSGEQNLLIILIELRRKLTPGSIVLIDEIENSLHPAFQHRLAQGLLALQHEIPYQLIVTTHARAFVEIFGPERTLLLTQF